MSDKLDSTTHIYCTTYGPGVDVTQGIQGINSFRTGSLVAIPRTSKKLKCL